MLKLIYVTGYGRSGSTILDILLDQHEAVFGMGELSTLCRHVWDQNEYCACRHRIRDCEFWAPVVSEWLRSGGNIAEYLGLQKRIEPLYTPLRRPGSFMLSRYLAQTESLLSLVARRAGVSVLVDSSKAPGRGLALASSKAIDLRVIHLVRDGRAVAHSMATRTFQIDPAKGLQKELKPRPAYRTAIRWRLYNAAAEKLTRRVGDDRAVLVRYEDLVANPLAELERIGRCVGLGLTSLGQRAAAHEPLTPRHQMAGSRIRMKDRLLLESDSAWESEIADADRRNVARLAGQQLRRYGYLRT